MGQAKAKKTFSEKFNKFDQSPVTGLGEATVIYVNKKGIPDLLKEIGSVSPAFDSIVKHMSENDDDRLQFIEWCKYPSGRQEIMMIGSEEDIRNDVIGYRFGHCTIRGLNMKAAIFNGGQKWPEYTEMKPHIDAHLLEFSNKEKSSKYVTVMNIDHESRALKTAHIPKITSETMSAKVVAELLALMDSMVSTKEKMLKNQGSLILSFEGYNDDTREIWDIPECKAVLLALGEFGRWWPWLSISSNFIVWLGAITKRGVTMKAPNSTVVLNMDLDFTQSLVQMCIDAIVKVFVDGGGSRDEFKEIEGPIAEFEQYVAFLIKRDREFAIGAT